MSLCLFAPCAGVQGAKPPSRFSCAVRLLLGMRATGDEFRTVEGWPREAVFGTGIAGGPGDGAG